MSALDSIGVTPAALIAILAATLVTYLCRIGGYWAMGFVTPSPRIERALAALPGSIVAAIVLPAIAQTGLVAAIAIVIALAIKLVARNDMLALCAGVATAIALRAMGVS
ncbi:AzlD domain-containing protein [Terrarubrum flagellatum]|uniref:AzlD family protein n=1 Tax=Terrirubrum flagellatum TaxID=2895980 RepID=UPI00314517DE